MILTLLFAAQLQDGVRSDAAAAAAAATRDDPPFTCVRDGSTPELNACGSDDLKREEARMQRYLDAANGRAHQSDEASGEFGEPTHQAAWLSASQQAWTAYAEIRCQGVLDEWKGGSVRTLAYLGCKIETTRQRTHDIWSDYLTYRDSTPPVLPEPVLTAAEEDRGDREP